MYGMNYKGRVINYSAKGRVHSWRDPWVYDATAQDVQSGISAEARHYDTSQEAIHHAVQNSKTNCEMKALLQSKPVQVRKGLNFPMRNMYKISMEICPKHVLPTTLVILSGQKNSRNGL